MNSYRRLPGRHRFQKLSGKKEWNADGDGLGGFKRINRNRNWKPSIQFLNEDNNSSNQKPVASDH